VFHRYVVLRSGWEWQIPATETPFIGPSSERNTLLAFRWLLDGTVDVSGLATIYAPSDGQAAYDALADGTATALTAAFDWRDPISQR
jgi:hypothetical protein